MSNAQTCPRRMLDWGAWERKENLDAWRTGGGLVGRQEHELSCSFCGSLHPDVFMDWVRQGGQISPTDKNYKAYIKYPGKDPREGETSEYELNMPSGRTVQGTSVYGIEAKFYYQHLSPEQRQEFVELYNNHTMQIGYPGNFYVLPFFMKKIDNLEH